jgi:hypothetical protein
MESMPIPGEGLITGIPFLGEHGDLQIRSKLGYHLIVGGGSVMFLADSNNLDSVLYRRVHDALGDVDHLFVGMECKGAPASWMYGPLFSQPLTRSMDQSRRLNASDSGKAKAIIDLFNPLQVSIYAMGAEPWLKYLSSIEYNQESLPIVESDRLIQLCRDGGIRCERLYGSQTIRFNRRVSQ